MCNGSGDLMKTVLKMLCSSGLCKTSSKIKLQKLKALVPEYFNLILFTM